MAIKIAHFATAKTITLRRHLHKITCVCKRKGGSFRAAFWPLVFKLQPFANHVFQQIADAAAVTPLVVIPADELEETFVQFNT